MSRGSRRRGSRRRLTLAVAAATVATSALVGFAVVASAASLTLTSQDLTPYRTCTITGTPTTTTAVADATVKQASATSNFGTATTTTVSSASAANQRLYVRFDLTVCSPAIPSSATVRLATIRLYASALPTSCRTVDVFKVLATWTESAITWNNQPFGTTINNPAAGSATTTFNVGTPAGCQNLAAGYLSGLTVTSDVAAFVGGTATNYGWMLRDNTEGNASAVTTTLSAKNLGTVGQAPQLVVTYVAVP